jgi:hypothetical protein
MASWPTGDEQPGAVCTDCGRRYGRRFRADHVSTWSDGTCDVCKRAAPVTEARDFGFLRPEWRMHR